MPIKPIMSIAYYAYCLISLLCLLCPICPPPKHTNGGDTPSRQGKESTTPFYPDAGRIAPIYARVLSLSLMSAFTPRSSFRCPSP